jgi:type VI secretion system lysozyme-like protein
VEELRESVRQHLVRLLNARHDMSEAVPDYGLPSLVDLTVGGGEYIPVIQRAIRVAIEKYEPRLRHVRVSCVREEASSGMPSVVFRVDAVLVGRTGEHAVGFVTAVTRDGQFSVAD